MSAPSQPFANSSDPSDYAAAITPSDSTNLSALTRGIYVGGTGDVVVVLFDDTTATFKACPVGLILPVRAKRVNSTGTTATFLVALY